MQREFLPSQPQFWHPQAPAELCERINCWRQQVEVCSPTRSPSPSQLQNIRRESVTSLSSAPRATRRHKPYSRTRFREASHTNLPDFHVTGLNTGLEELNQYGLHRETMRVLPRVLDERCEASCRTPTIRDFRGMDLPHPEHNPLIALYSDVVKEEYRRIASLFYRLSVGQQKAELQWLEHTSHEAMEKLMDVGVNIQRVLDAAQYIVNYSQYHNWDIDFAALANEDYSPPARVLPSHMRELVCPPGFTADPMCNTEWHLYPAV